MRRCALREGHGDVSGFFFFNDTATTEIYTLSLHDALPILGVVAEPAPAHALRNHVANVAIGAVTAQVDSEDALEPHLRSEEHTSELQSQSNLVCRLLLEKKKHPLQATLALLLCSITQALST